MRALVLAGHGSHISPDTAGVVWSYVDQLRGWGVADEITACFWKEAPSFNQVLDTLVSEHVTVVPVFAAAGYFSQKVIPAEMGLEGPLTRRDGRTIHYTDHRRRTSLTFSTLSSQQSCRHPPIARTSSPIRSLSQSSATEHRAARHSQDTVHQQVTRCCTNKGWWRKLSLPTWMMSRPVPACVRG